MPITRATFDEHRLTADPIRPEVADRHARKMRAIQAAHNIVAATPCVVFDGSPEVINACTKQGVFVAAWVFVPGAKL